MRSPEEIKAEIAALDEEYETNRLTLLNSCCTGRYQNITKGAELVILKSNYEQQKHKLNNELMISMYKYDQEKTA